MLKRLFVPAFLLAAALPLAAQFQGRLEGLVTDAQGNPLEKVEVNIVSTKTVSMHFTLTTDKAGKFLQIGLMPGYFQVSLKKEGFAPKSTEVHVPIDGIARIGVKMDTADAMTTKTLSEADKVFLRGNKLLGEQKVAEAVAAFEEAVRLNPANWGYFLNLGLARKKLGKPEEAKAAFAKAAELNPQSFSANKELGEALARAGDHAGAKASYEKALALSPDDPDAHYNLGVTLMNTGESEAALAQFQKTIALKPDSPDAYYYQGTILVGQNKIPEAIESLETFLKLAPTHPQAEVAKQILAAIKKG